MTRSDKIKALQAIQDGRGTIAPLMGTVWEFWTAKKPDIFINELTGQSLTTTQLNERKHARPYLIFFVTQLSHPDNDPIL